jgi:hypothetical protein
MSVEYPIESYTYGFEIEWGDIDRTLEIPSHLGTWEYAEIDVVNIHEPYKYIAVDPLGIDPPMGGEINTRPSKTWKEQTDLIMEIYQLFVDNGNSPSCACTNHNNFHIHVPGLRDDISALKRLIKYIQRNQKRTIKDAYAFKRYPEMEGVVLDDELFLEFDGGVGIPDETVERIINRAKNFDDFMRLYYQPHELQGDLPPIRHAVNTYTLQDLNTIEWRCFRASTERKHIEDSFKFAAEFISAALNGGPKVKHILAEYDYEFPPFTFNAEEYMGWKKTIHKKSRALPKKHRHYQEVK